MSKSKNFWEMKQAKYPFQTEVPHMSPQDVNPRRVNEETSHLFLRVPFDGVAHWGFETQAGLDWFLSCGTGGSNADPSV